MIDFEKNGIYDHFVSVAKILNFHGITGEVKLGYSNDQKDNLKKYRKFFIKIREDLVELNVENIRFHKNFAIVKFKQFNSINDMERYRGENLYVEKKEVLSNLSENEFLISELEGLSVKDVNDRQDLGKVEAISSNKASYLLNIRGKDGRIYLVPFVKELVPEVNIGKGFIVIKNIEGLVFKDEI